MTWRNFPPEFTHESGLKVTKPDPLPDPYRMVEVTLPNRGMKVIKGRFLGFTRDNGSPVALVELPGGKVGLAFLHNIRFTTGLMDTDTDTDKEAPDGD